MFIELLKHQIVDQSLDRFIINTSKIGLIVRDSGSDDYEVIFTTSLGQTEGGDPEYITITAEAAEKLIKKLDVITL